MNEPAETWATNLTGVNCRLEGRAGKEESTVAQVVDATGWLFCEAGVDIVETDRVVVWSRTFEVLYVNREPGGVTDHHYEVAVKEIRV